MTPDTGNFGDYFYAGLALMYAQRWLKDHSTYYQRFIVWAPIADKWGHRVVAIVGSFFVAVGVHYTIAGNAGEGWHIGLVIPNLDVLYHGFWDWLKVLVVQQFGYDATRSVPAGTPGSAPASVRVMPAPHGEQT